MRVQDLQQFLSKFTEGKKDGSRQGNALSNAVIYVEINGYINNIKKGAIIGTENGFVESMTETGQAITSQINTGIKQGDTFKYLDVFLHLLF